MVQSLPSLQHLALQAGTIGILADGFPVSIATSCSQLRHLEIRGGGLLGYLPEELGRLEGLTRLELHNAGVMSLPDTISRLSSLRELDLTSNYDLSLPDRLPAGLTACQQLTRLHIDFSPTSPVLASLRSLRCLSVGSAPLMQPHEMFWTQLTALTELQLQCSGDGEVPAGLAGMTGLRTIGIDGATLDDLPPGPYLSGLESLSMTGTIFLAGVPASLAAATQLQHLGIVSLEGLSDADVAMLCSLPALKTLVLHKPFLMEQPVWEEYVAELQAECLLHGRALVSSRDNAEESGSQKWLSQCLKTGGFTSAMELVRSHRFLLL